MKALFIRIFAITILANSMLAFGGSSPRTDDKMPATSSPPPATASQTEEEHHCDNKKKEKKMKKKTKEQKDDNCPATAYLDDVKCTSAVTMDGFSGDLPSLPPESRPAGKYTRFVNH